MRYVFAVLAALACCCPAYAQTFTVTAKWEAPTQHTDGSPISGLTGYVVYYSAAPRPATCTHSTTPNPSASGSQRAACTAWVAAAGKVEVDSATTQQVLTNAQLAANTQYYFSVTARKGAVESDFSNQQAATTPDTRTPGAPTNVTVEITFQAGAAIGQ